MSRATHGKGEKESLRNSETNCLLGQGCRGTVDGTGSLGGAGEYFDRETASIRRSNPSMALR